MGSPRSWRKIELFGSEFAPQVREEIARRNAENDPDLNL